MRRRGRIIYHQIVSFTIMQLMNLNRCHQQKEPTLGMLFQFFCHINMDIVSIVKRKLIQIKIQMIRTSLPLLVRLQSISNAAHFFKSLHLIFNRFSSLTSRYYLFIVCNHLQTLFISSNRFILFSIASHR